MDLRRPVPVVGRVVDARPLPARLGRRRDVQIRLRSDVSLGQQVLRGAGGPGASSELGLALVRSFVLEA